MKGKLLTLVIALAALYACKRKCKDMNSENYGVRENCTYRYWDGITVNSFPARKPNGASWDTVTNCENAVSPPDLKLHFYPDQQQLNGPGEFFTDVSDDATGSVNLQVSCAIPPCNPLKMTRQTWYFELLDYDPWPCAPPEVMGTGSFNPLEQGSNGEIIVTGTNGVNITIHYHN